MGFHPGRRAYPVSTNTSNSISNKKGWMVGTNQTYGIGRPHNVNHVVSQKTTPYNYQDGELKDDRNLVVQQNTLSGVGKMRSQFMSSSAGIKSVRYYIGDENNIPCVNEWNIINGTQFSTYGYGIHYGGGRWVATGATTDTILYSDDGKSWNTIDKINGTQFNITGYGIHYGGGRWVAVGATTDTILYSDDGKIWKNIDTINGTQFTGNGRSVYYGGGRWVAVGAGSGTTILYSDDGEIWKNINTINGTQFNSCGYGIHYGDGHWVAVGDGTNTIVYSDDGKTWNTITGTQFTGNGGNGIDVYYGGGRWVAVGDSWQIQGGVNYLTYTTLYSC